MHPITDRDHVIFAHEGEPIPVDDVAPVNDAVSADNPAPTHDGDGGSWLSELFSWAGDQISTLLSVVIDLVAPIIPALLVVAFFMLVINLIIDGKGGR